MTEKTRYQIQKELGDEYRRSDTHLTFTQWRDNKLGRKSEPNLSPYRLRIKALTKFRHFL